MIFSIPSPCSPCPPVINDKLFDLKQMTGPICCPISPVSPHGNPRCWSSSSSPSLSTRHQSIINIQLTNLLGPAWSRYNYPLQPTNIRLLVFHWWSDLTDLIEIFHQSLSYHPVQLLQEIKVLGTIRSWKFSEWQSCQLKIYFTFLFEDWSWIECSKNEI